MSPDTQSQQPHAELPPGSQGVVRKGWLPRVWRLVLRSLLTLLVLSTLYVGGGRLLMPVVTAQKDKVEARLGQLLGTQVDIAQLRGSWYRLSPSFALEGLVLQLDAADPGTRFAIERGEMSLDLWSSLQLGQLSLNHVALSGLELSLQQSADGRWTLRGLPPGERDYKDLILDLLLKTPSISLQETSVRVTLADGRELPLQSVFLQLENDGRRHDLSLQFRLGNRGQPQHAVLQLQGDPRSAFTADAWVSLTQLDLQPQLAGMLPSEWQLDQFMVDTDLWLELDQRGLRSVKAQVDDLRVRGELGSMPVVMANTVLTLGAWPEDGAGDPVWRLAVRDMALDFNDVLLAPGRMNLRLPLAPEQPWTLQAESLDVATLAALAASFPLPEAGREALTALAPAGRLGPVYLESDRSGNYPDGFLLRTGFQALSVGAWRAAPAGSGLQGYAELVAGRGFAEVDSVDASLYLPNLFRAPWRYDRINTRVSWELGPGEVRVSSSPISVSSADLQGRVQFALHNTGMGTPDFRSDLSLAVGMDWMDVAIHADYLPTLPRTADTMRWLDEALISGRIVDSGFLLRNSTARQPGLDSLTHTSWFRVENGVLRFLPDWPAVEIASAGIFVNNQHTDVRSTRASIGGIAATQVQASVRPLAAGGSLLQLQVEALADTNAGLDFLRNTPVRAQVGGALDGWQGSGSLEVDVALQQPLGGAALEQQLQVEARAMGGGLDITSYQLQLADLDGVIRYRNDSGLQTKGLQARLFDKPVSIDIETLAPARGSGRNIRILGGGRAEPRTLAAWSGQPAFVSRLLQFTTGEIEYRAQVDIPVGGAEGMPRLQLESDLVGVETAFPPPFAKAAEDAVSLQLDLRFDPAGRELSLRYEDWLSGHLMLDAGSVPRGQLHFGSLNRDFNIRQSSSAAPGLLISGELPDFDYDAWSAVAERFAQDSAAGDAALQDYLRLVDVSVGRLQVIGQEFSDIDVELLFREGAWRIQGTNEKVSGTLTIPEDSTQPWQVALDYLRFPPRPEPDPEATEPPEDIDLLEGVDPTELPAFAFSTQELSIGPSNLGSWSFDFAPLARGARISNLRMQEEASRIYGATAEDGASVIWNYRAGLHDSRFDGVFAAGDLATVMPKWGHDANIVSRDASFVSALTWPGSPLAFSLKKASGDIDMAIDSGRFVDIESGSSRLLGAFNFDSLVRRLELDFSDLYQRGFAFDTIRGQLGFTDGVVRFTTPLVIDGPSSRISIEGEINLPLETIAADMQVRIPLGENISMLAGLLGAWPIALSTYLASKIFADQVEDFTTIIYRLDGPWSNPQAGFEPPEEPSATPAP